MIRPLFVSLTPQAFEKIKAQAPEGLDEKTIDTIATWLANNIFYTEDQKLKVILPYIYNDEVQIKLEESDFLIKFK